ncbi:MAG: porin [Verrucomicrobia bacterium]|nr:porin [Verrucomicrobiota bacterium]
MKVHSRVIWIACATIMLVALGTTRTALGAAMADDEKLLNVNGQLQLHGIVENVDDPYSDSTRLFLFLRQARLSVNGEYMDSKYEIEWMLGGEEVPERNSVMSLLDAYIITPLNDDVNVKLGQFKVPYGRERLLDSGKAFNVNRSIGNNYFNIGRDVGMALQREGDQLSGAIGMFTGGGINIPERYIPEDIGVPMFVARVGINNGVDADVFTPVDATSAKDHSGFAAYVNGMYNKDSRVGHSTPLNVKYFDKSLMLNSDYNPYISAHDEKSEFYQFGADVAWLGEVGDDAHLLLSAEGHISTFDNNLGSLETVGGLVAANVILENSSVGVRYGYVEPDSDMAYTETIPAPMPGGAPSTKLHKITNKAIHEITSSIVYFVPDTAVKVIAEFSYQMDVPVAVEKGNGVYNLMRQADQASYVTSGGIDLQDNFIANLVVQYNF